MGNSTSWCFYKFTTAFMLLKALLNYVVIFFMFCRKENWTSDPACIIWQKNEIVQLTESLVSSLLSVYVGSYKLVKNVACTESCTFL